MLHPLTKRPPTNLITNESDVLENNYERILSWFVASKDTSVRIFKSGQNKSGKWWFLVRKGEDTEQAFKVKLNYYAKIGFQIPDLSIEKDLQLIAEPGSLKKQNGDTFTCKSCGHTLDLSSNIGKSNKIKGFHTVKFPRREVPVR
jgi:hypothetical protein